MVACHRILAGGLVLLAGPYMTLKGGVGTKPGIARVLGLAPRSQPLALEREKPLPPGQTTSETYQIATIRMLKVFRAAVTPPLFPFALLGLVLAAVARGPSPGLRYSWRSCWPRRRSRWCGSMPPGDIAPSGTAWSPGSF